RDPIPVARLLTNAASLFPHEPRLTLAGLLSHHRVPYRQSDALTELWPPGGGTARAHFDGLGRFVHWESELRPAALGSI
ncbi:hypothetical protein E1298_42740, partial [Actinomadura rubrisoli]